MILTFFKSDTTELKINRSIDGPIEEFMVRKSWIHINNPTEEDINLVSRKTGINKDMMRTALDEEETAHVDIDDGVTMVIIDTPVVDSSDEDLNISLYYTTPFFILYNDDYFVTICNKDNMILSSLTSRGMKNFATNKHIKLTIQILYQNASIFVNLLKQLNKESDYTQKQLQLAMKNKELFELMSLGKSLVYLSTGSNANQLVLERIRRLSDFRKYEEDIELIEDAMIENRQAMEMCNIHRDILNGTMDAYASIISNNVNAVMKTLTIVTICLTIPTLIASFLGMNMIVPLANHPYGFIIIVLISIILSGTGAWILMRITNPRRKK